MRHIVLTFILSIISIISVIFYEPQNISAASSKPKLVVLTTYSKTMAVNEEFNLFAVSSDGKFPTFSSSNSKVASVNSYGKVTAKSAGTAKITAKVSKGEASCKITVKKTEIELSKTSIKLEASGSANITAKVSTGTKPKYKSSKTSVAIVDENGCITAKKPGETTITVSADGSVAKCNVVVKEPKIKVEESTINIYRNEVKKVKYYVSSKKTPTFKCNKSSVAVVDKNGNIKGIKHGTAVLTISVDGAEKKCVINVNSPKITLQDENVTLRVGDSYQVKAKVSSKNEPSYSSNKSSVAIVDSAGKITAVKKGTAVISVSEDGAKESLIVTVTD